jgi:hypothetical protein
MVIQAAAALAAGAVALGTSVPVASALFALPGVIMALVGLLVVGRRYSPVPAPVLAVGPLGAGVPDSVPAA